MMTIELLIETQERIEKEWLKLCEKHDPLQANMYNAVEAIQQARYLYMRVQHLENSRTIELGERIGINEDIKGNV